MIGLYSYFVSVCCIVTFVQIFVLLYMYIFFLPVNKIHCKLFSHRKIGVKPAKRNNDLRDSFACYSRSNTAQAACVPQKKLIFQQ